MNERANDQVNYYSLDCTIVSGVDVKPRAARISYARRPRPFFLALASLAGAHDKYRAVNTRVFILFNEVSKRRT